MDRRSRREEREATDESPKPEQKRRRRHSVKKPEDPQEGTSPAKPLEEPTAADAPGDLEGVEAEEHAEATVSKPPVKRSPVARDADRPGEDPVKGKKGKRKGEGKEGKSKGKDLNLVARGVVPGSHQTFSPTTSSKILSAHGPGDPKTGKL